MVFKMDTKLCKKSIKCKDERDESEDVALANLIKEGQRQAQTAQTLVKRLNNLQDVRVSGGPFHYFIRAGTYGEQYDEPPWKLGLGIEESKERSGFETNPMKCKYEPRVLLNNWVEERRDRLHIKYDNAPRLSEYGYAYKSEYATSYSKPVICNKPRDVLLKIKSFPFTAHPGLQPDLDIAVVRYSSPKPENCILDEKIARCRKDTETQKRYDRQTRELSGGLQIF